MIIQPEKGTRNVNDLFYESEKKRIDMLNREFFHDVELTKKENDVLVWLCGWDNWTIEAVVDVFRKVRELLWKIIKKWSEEQKNEWNN